MDIKGLDYNTQREKLVLPEYGREIQKMVAHAATLPTKEERLRCARSIVRLMETKVPQLRGHANREQTLWDHLYLMSNKELDIDWPYDVSGAEKIMAAPTPVALPQSKIRLRHYGKLVETLAERLKAMGPGRERDTLVRQTAHQMKRDLLTWGHGMVDDAKVINDLAYLTDGAIQIDPAKFKFEKVSAVTEDVKPAKKKKK